jgi:hypothetical protein
MKTFFVFLLLIFALALFLAVGLMSGYEQNRTQKIGPVQNGSERPFFQRLRAPDTGFLSHLMMVSLVLPFSIGFFGLGIEGLQAAANPFLGSEAWASRTLRLVVDLVQRIIVPAVFCSFVGMQVLRGYVLLKLRRQRSRKESEAA